LKLAIDESFVTFISRIHSRAMIMSRSVRLDGKPSIKRTLSLEDWLVEPIQNLIYLTVAEFVVIQPMLRFATSAQYSRSLTVH
jgi:hypothetical protein